jgi:hypothetical protein
MNIYGHAGPLEFEGAVHADLQIALLDVFLEITATAVRFRRPELATCFGIARGLLRLLREPYPGEQRQTEEKFHSCIITRRSGRVYIPDDLDHSFCTTPLIWKVGGELTRRENDLIAFGILHDDEVAPRLLFRRTRELHSLGCEFGVLRIDILDLP